MSIPDYVLRNSYNPKSEEASTEQKVTVEALAYGQVTYWIEILQPPPEGTTWYRYFVESYRKALREAPKEFFGFAISQKHLKSIIAEMQFGPLFPQQANILGCPCRVLNDPILRHDPRKVHEYLAPYNYGGPCRAPLPSPSQEPPRVCGYLPEDEIHKKP